MPSEKLLSALIIHLQPSRYSLHPGHHTAARQCSLVTAKHALYSYKLLIWLKQKLTQSQHALTFTRPVIGCNVTDTDITKTNQCQWKEDEELEQGLWNTTKQVVYFVERSGSDHFCHVTLQNGKNDTPGRNRTIASKCFHYHCSIGVARSITGADTVSPSVLRDSITTLIVWRVPNQNQCSSSTEKTTNLLN